MPVQLRWKGKERAILDDIDEGTDGEDGVVVSLTLVGTGVYDAVYTIPVSVGDGNQQFSLQIDTGSSDLWIASTSCSSSSCSQTNGHLYDPSGATPTNVSFSIPYLSGSAAGPIFWDNVTIGGYTIDNQALAAASDVENEALAPNFSGILGLALPLNSIIASEIPPVTNNDPDGAAWASNLFSITPISTSPSSRFLSLALSRPGSNTVPAVFGIGHHPSSLVPDPSLVQYSTPVSDESGILFWKVSVKAITVYVNGTARSVELGRSITGASFPVAVLDSGMPLILTTSDIANGIYGAIRINPASDGNYYVPCTTPLNMTITLDDRPEIPLHPLDLTAEPPQDNQAQYCLGLIQTDDSQLSNPDSSLGDMILGVPFLRNVYTVMAYTIPNSDGSFVPQNGSDQTITPRLGLLSLTNATIALEEFNTVRVLNQPISGGGSSPAGGNANNSTVSLGGKKLSVGIVVLIGILSFFALCCMLFFACWFMFRRKYRKSALAGMQQTPEDVYGLDKSPKMEPYVLSNTISSTTKDEKSSTGNDDGYVGLKSEAVALAAGIIEEKIFSDSIMKCNQREPAVVDVDDQRGIRTEQVLLGRGRGRGIRDAEWALQSVASGQSKLNTLLYRLEEPDYLHSSIPPSSSSSSPDQIAFNPPPFPSQNQQSPTPSARQSLTMELPYQYHPQMSSPIYDHQTGIHETHAELDDTNDVRTSMADIGTAYRTSKIYLDSNFLRGMDMNSPLRTISTEFDDDDEQEGASIAESSLTRRTTS